MKKILLFLVLVPGLLQAQDKKKIDSLELVVKHSKNPLTKTKAYLQLSSYTYKGDIKTSKSYMDSAYKLSRINTTDSLQMIIYKKYAEYFDDTGKPDSTLRYVGQGMALANKTNNTVIKSAFFNIRGNALLAKRNFKDAESAYLDAMRIYAAANNEFAVGNLYVNIGYLFQQQGLVKEAEKQYAQANIIFKKLGDNDRLAQLYNNYGILYGENNKLALSEQYFEASTRIREKLTDQVALANSYMNVGAISLLLKKYAKAETFLLKGKAIFEKMNNVQGITSSLTNLGDLEEKKNNLPQAISFYKQSIALATKYHNNEDLENALLNIGNLYSKTGDYKTAFAYRNELGTVKDSIYKKSLTSQIAEMHTRYETEKKENEIGLLNKESIIQKLTIANRNISISIIIVVFVLSFAMAVIYYNRYKSKQQASLQAEVIHQQELAAKGIIEAEERERKRIAGDLHDGVGQLFSAVKMNMEILVERFLLKQPDAEQLAEKTMAMVDESCAEVRSIAHQMMPNALIKSGLVSALRDFINNISSDKLKISIETKGINDSLESDTETVLYRVIQEAVNNVIKHANATALDILLLSDYNEITVAIEDNGKGFDMADKSKFTGIGLKNMQSRIEYLKGTVDVSSEPGKGTLVAIYIPL